MVISISFRTGNFATGSLLPDTPTLEHWSLALGIPLPRPTGRWCCRLSSRIPYSGGTVKIALITAALTLAISTTGAYAFVSYEVLGQGTILKSMMIFQILRFLALVAIYALFDNIEIHQLDGHRLSRCRHCSVLGGMAVRPDDQGLSLRLHRVRPGRSGYRGQLRDHLAHFGYILVAFGVPILSVAFILAFIMSITEYPIASVCSTKAN